ncbi:methylglyoxal reductase (NADPH-dependent) gre2 [Serendipita sp. 407]|nr:methylglyoxal reductase (NADPH-dependent) gre2 [Serendipita sp. 398]KAG9023270.1 methylglyoxal reductase (NADPH-dependent) gre2 [Serendipita sp. 407]
MSAVQAPALIVVTGSAIIVNLLHKGFAVQKYIDPGDLTFVVVTDTTAPNAFKDAVQGGLSDASSDPPADPKEILGPEIGMNIRVLEAATDTPTIKRAISTSSNDWFDSAPEIVEHVGAKATGPLKYIASKVLAERAAWGRDLFSNPETIRPTASNARLLKALSHAKSGTMKEEDCFTLTEFTDLLEVAEGHVRALVTPAAAGERIALRGGHVTRQDISDLVNNTQIPGVKAAICITRAGKRLSPDKYFAAEKAGEILEMTYRPQEDTRLDTIRSGSSSDGGKNEILMSRPPCVQYDIY